MTSFVLIPGAGGGAWYWHRLVPELHRRGHDAVPVDLPPADDPAGLEAYVEALLTAADGRDDIVLVAQSMGGLTAPLVCERIPVRLLVMLNAMVPEPGETGNAWWVDTGHEEAFRQHAATEGRAVGELDSAEVFFHDVAPDVVAEAVRRGDPAQSGRPFEDPWPLDAWPDVPTRFLQGTDDRFFPLDFRRRVVRERRGADVDEMPGGHLLALSQPAALADRLEAYLWENHHPHEERIAVRRRPSDARPR